MNIVEAIAMVGLFAGGIALSVLFVVLICAALGFGQDD